MSKALAPEVRKFVLLHMDVEAVLQRCGLRTYDLVFIDGEGNWTRSIFPSEEAAQAAAEVLDVPVHKGWNDRMTKRMNKRDHWNEPGGQRRAL